MASKINNSGIQIIKGKSKARCRETVHPLLGVSVEVEVIAAQRAAVYLEGCPLH